MYSHKQDQDKEQCHLPESSGKSLNDHPQHPEPQASQTCLLSLRITYAFSGISLKWNHTLFILLLTFFFLLRIIFVLIRVVSFTSSSFLPDAK